MESSPIDSREELLDAWDAVPRDGPAIFVATCDGGRPLYGTWVRVDQPEPYLRGELELLFNEAGHRHDHTWVVLDQVRLGDTMLPERLSLAGLHRLQIGVGTRP